MAGGGMNGAKHLTDVPVQSFETISISPKKHISEFPSMTDDIMLSTLYTAMEAFLRSQIDTNQSPNQRRSFG